MSWEAVGARKRAQRDERIPPEWRLPSIPSGDVHKVPRTCGILTAAEVRITETAADVLVSRMSRGELTAVAVVTAFCKRAAIAQQLVNCLTEIMFDEAIAEARVIDDEFAQTRKPRGPLHGLPMSLKDNIDVPGFDSSTGFTNRVGEIAVEYATLAQALKDAGAVFHCKTNVPTGMLMGETYNNVWGYSSNPYNTAYACGGSSGGEGALLGLKGSPLGVGSDIAGSIRLPSAACGVFGLKPSPGRFSMQGMRPGASPGQEAVKGVTGPMSSDLVGLEMLTRTIIDAKLWETDPSVLEIPWRDITLPQQLCFGLILDDGAVRPTPAVTRVLLETKAALEAAGHRVVVWTPPGDGLGPKLLMKLLHGDGGAKLRSLVVGGKIPEPWPEGLSYYEKIYQRSRGAPPLVADLWDVQLERTAFLRTLLKAWTDSKDVTDTGRPFDGVIAPVTAFPACPRYKFRYTGYCSLWNLSEQTAVSFPAGSARRTDTGKIDGYRNADEREIWTTYNPAELEGMPVGLQAVTTRHSEEKALKLTRVIVDALEASKAKKQGGKL